jgi:hypothetical protein
VFDQLEELAELPGEGFVDERFAAVYEGGDALLDELVATLDDGAMPAYRHLLTEVAAHRAGHDLLRALGTAAYTELAEEVSAESFTGARAEDVRRLAAVRFADQDPTFPAAIDRALAVAPSLERGDVALAEAVGDAAQELHVWVVLLAVWRAGPEHAGSE